VQEYPQRQFYHKDDQRREPDANTSQAENTSEDELPFDPLEGRGSTAAAWARAACKGAIKSAPWVSESAHAEMVQESIRANESTWWLQVAPQGRGQDRWPAELRMRGFRVVRGRTKAEGIYVHLQGSGSEDFAQLVAALDQAHLDIRQRTRNHDPSRRGNRARLQIKAEPFAVAPSGMLVVDSRMKDDAMWPTKQFEKLAFDKRRMGHEEWLASDSTNADSDNMGYNTHWGWPSSDSSVNTAQSAGSVAEERAQPFEGTFIRL
jgi:hypothetical protein